MKGGGRGQGGEGGGGAPAAFSPLGEPLTANDVQHKYMCVSSENSLSNSQGASGACPHVEVVKCMLLTASNTSSDFVKLNLYRPEHTEKGPLSHQHTNYYSRSLNNIYRRTTSTYTTRYCTVVIGISYSLCSADVGASIHTLHIDNGVGETIS